MEEDFTFTPDTDEPDFGEEVFVCYRGLDAGYGHYIGNGWVLLDTALDDRFAVTPADVALVCPFPAENAARSQIIKLSAIEYERQGCWSGAMMDAAFWKQFLP